MRAWPIRKPAGGARRPAVFLDRDGVLVHNRDGYYLTDPAKMRVYPFVARALRLLAAAGFRLIVVTNQSGVGRGYMTMRTAVEINRKLARLLRKEGAPLDAVYFCPHTPSTGCACRKPGTGLLKEAFREFPSARGGSWMVGDKFSDLGVAERGGLKPVFVLTGQGRTQLRKKGAPPRGTLVARDLLSAARALIRGARAPLAAALFLFCPPGLRAEEPAVMLAHPLAGATEIVLSTSSPAVPWAGERLDFELKWGMVGVGESHLSALATVSADGEAAWHLASGAVSASWIDGFFKVRDRNDSWMAVSDHRSLGYSKDIREGSWRLREWVYFDYSTMTFRGQRLKKDDAPYAVGGTLPGRVNDILSALYAVRLMPLEPGAVYTMDVNTRKNWKLDIAVLKREKIKTALGKKKCLVVEPRVGEEGIFAAKKGKRLLVWLTDDEFRVPVLLKAEVFIGAVTAELKRRTVTPSPAP
ncbi:MAG: D-glycero-D-manno-heptose 1 7-bisphosphate phosphatase [Elusimicrobia bacterium]|nr:MAG: D-glycero-D-manno-heptose 1 7-bisphosphate phosphatase [Elusimicrobiota bacterium]KAF0156596.1 MAG: D-glycero-D-manno-heptose 1 7-bisphosphate phosphatase [Elusimicrobiota bacterium]